MAGCKVIFFTFLSVGLLASLTSAQLMVPCNYTEIQGPYCHDCSTRAICTPLGGILVFKCWLPHLNHCVDGHCARDPSPDCTKPHPPPPPPSTTTGLPPTSPASTTGTTPPTEGTSPTTEGTSPSTQASTTVA